MNHVSDRIISILIAIILGVDMDREILKEHVKVLLQLY